MLFAQKSNRVQPIKDTEIQRFLNLGYNITDETGKILHEAVPTTEAALKTAFVRHTKEIASLKGQVASLRAELESIKVAKATTNKRTRTSKSDIEPNTKVVDSTEE